MAQEYQTHDCVVNGVLGSSTGKSFNRKSKQWRAPQRGLGVAQLEKIRLQEHHNKNATSKFPNPSALSPPKTKTKTTIKTSSNLSVLPPNLHPINQSPTSPSNFVFKSPLHSHNIDDTTWSNSNPLAQLNFGGFETGWSDMPVLSQGQIPKLVSPIEFHLQKDRSLLDSNLGFRSNFCFTNESNIDWPSPGLVQEELQHQLPSYAGVDVSSSSPLLNFLTEPPSNQSYYSNYTAVFPEMFGMKRPYAFSVDNPAGPSLNWRPPMAATMRSDEYTSCSNVGFYIYPSLGEGPSCSSSSSEPNLRKKMKGNAFTGDLLTLATPTTTWMCQSSKLKHLSAHVVGSNHEFADLVSMPLRKGGMEIPTCPHPEPSWSNRLQPYNCFFPPSMAQNGQASPKTLGRFSVEDESVDLNLKL